VVSITPGPRFIPGERTPGTLVQEAGYYVDAPVFNQLLYVFIKIAVLIIQDVSEIHGTTIGARYMHKRIGKKVFVNMGPWTLRL
jgi:hypothetical protein